MHAALRAHQIVSKAIYHDQLIRPDFCEKCNKPPNIGWFTQLHAHHEDYSRPLDVTWLCRSCHAKRHSELGWGKTTGNSDRRKARRKAGKK